MSLANCKLMNLPKIKDPRGNLTYVENCDQVPFNIKRVYYLYDVPGGSFRGSHAHKNLHQFFIAVSGSFDIVLDDGLNKKTFNMNRSFLGLYICPMIWRKLENFTSGAVCLVLASEKYLESDYIRNYNEFIRKINN